MLGLIKSQKKKTMNLVDSACVIMLSARSMALTSALSIEVLLGSCFVILVLCLTAAHDTLFLFLELSV